MQGGTYFPFLQLYNRNVSSSPAVTIVWPESSKDMPVICRGYWGARGEVEPGEGGSTALLKIFAGLNFVYTLRLVIRASSCIENPY